MRKLINKIGGIVILGILLVSIYPFIVGGDQMKEFCTNSKGNELKDEFIKRAEVKGYRVLESSKDNNNILAIDDSAMGRFICEVTLDKNSISSYKYTFND